jgi:uncharacterized membrane protein YjjP (DUF1212 family)
MLNRHEFLRLLAKALTFAAPSHRIETQLVFAAKKLNVPAEFSHLPSVIIISFVDDETHTSETHFIKCGGRLQLGHLQEIHKIYKEVPLHDTYILIVMRRWLGHPIQQELISAVLAPARSSKSGLV